jgi:hypothetical protein
MPFTKGTPKPPNSGRKKGQRNKEQDSIVAFSRSILENADYQANFRERAVTGQLAPALESMLYHYAYGKPIEPNRDDEAFVGDLLGVVLKHVGDSAEARKEILEVIEAQTTSGHRLRAVA